MTCVNASDAHDDMSTPASPVVLCPLLMLLQMLGNVGNIQREEWLGGRSSFPYSFSKRKPSDKCNVILNRCTASAL